MRAAAAIPQRSVESRRKRDERNWNSCRDCHTLYCLLYRHTDAHWLSQQRWHSSSCSVRLVRIQRTEISVSGIEANESQGKISSAAIVNTWEPQFDELALERILGKHPNRFSQNCTLIVEERSLYPRRLRIAFRALRRLPHTHYYRLCWGTALPRQDDPLIAHR